MHSPPAYTEHPELTQKCKFYAGLYDVEGRCRTQPDKSSICVVDDKWFPKSAITPGVQGAASPLPFFVLEEPMVIRELVDENRAEQDSHE